MYYYDILFYMGNVKQNAASPFFSLLIPAYNAENYIGRCIDSLISQSFKDVEIIIADDCSTDSTLSLIKSYESRYSFITVIRNEVNSGVVETRDRLICNSVGRYIVFVDADDFYLRDDRLQNIYDEIVLHSADMVITGYTIGTVPEKSLQLHYKMPKGFYDGVDFRKEKESIFKFNRSGWERDIAPNLWSKTVRRELYENTVGHISRTIRMGEDCMITLLLLAGTSSLSIIDDVSYFYCQNQGQASRGYFKGYYKEFVDGYINLLPFLECLDSELSWDDIIYQNVLHAAAYAILNEGRNPDKAKALDMVMDICQDKRIIKAMEKDYQRGINFFYRYILRLIKHNRIRHLGVIGRLYCCFFQ